MNFLKKEYSDSSSKINLIYLDNEFYHHKKNQYKTLDLSKLKSKIMLYLDSIETINQERVKITKSLVEGFVEGIKALTYIEAEFSDLIYYKQPSEKISGKKLIPFKNTILNTQDWSKIAYNPEIINFSHIPYDLKANYDGPASWLKFLDSVWGNDEDSIETLQEIMGLLLTGETKYQKMFLLLGPRRSGKGTISRLIVKMLGLNNTTNPTASSLSSDFGLQSFINKLCILMSDARFDGRQIDKAKITENLLRISGEDFLSIPRKYKLDWSGRLPGRVLIFSNEIPSLYDPSGALAGRFITLKMNKSFFGKENLDLEKSLEAEIPQIILWSLEGLKRLQNRGYFKQPESGLDAYSQLEATTSPIKIFSSEMCELGQDKEVSTQRLFDEWKRWCGLENIQGVGSKNHFTRKLQSTFNEIKVVQRGSGKRRSRHYTGISLVDDQVHGRTRQTVTL